MENILIFKDVERIDSEAFFYENNVLTFINGFEPFLTAIGIEFSLAQIIQINSYAHKTQGRGINELEHHLKEFIYDGLLSKAGTPNFGGVAISREKLKELIQFPESEYNSLLNHIKNTQPYNYGASSNGIDGKYLNYSDGVATLKDNFQDMLEADYSYYTKNDSGVYYTNLLNAIASKMNEYENSLRYNRKKSSYQFQAGAVNGIKLNGKYEYVVDLGVIRKLESVNTPFIVVEENEVE